MKDFRKLQVWAKAHPLALTLDRFFDFIGGDVVVVSQGFDGITGFVSFGEN